MTRMLGALVASMTVGALCLDWMQPVRTAVPPAPGIELMARGLAGKTWEGIRIETRPQDGTLHPEDAHFLIYRNGDRKATPNWDARRILGTAPIVQVTLVAAPGSQGLTVVQRETARKLVDELQRAYGIPTDRVTGADKLAQGPQSSSESADLLAAARTG